MLVSTFSFLGENMKMIINKENDMRKVIKRVGMEGAIELFPFFKPRPLVGSFIDGYECAH